MAEFVNIPLTISLEDSPKLEYERGDLEHGIDNILDLIVFTPKGTFSADPEFGFEYLNHEFSNVNVREFNNSYVGLMSSSRELNDVNRKQCEESIKESILTYEQRLLHPDVKVELGNSSLGRRSGNKQSKYEMHIVITGVIEDGLMVTRPYEKRISFMVEPIARKFSI